MSNLQNYQERVDKMSPQQKARTLANHERLKDSDRWEALEQGMRNSLDSMAALLVPQEVAEAVSE